MQSNSLSSEQAPDTSGDPPGAGTPTARRSEILHWESLAWLAIGAAWVVSAWPGLLVQWDGLAGAAVIGLGVLAGFVAWQVIVHGARLDRPSSWVGARWRAARPGRRAKSRRLLAMTVMLDAAAWSVSGISWIVAARAFAWSQTLTGASLQLACGVAFLGWGLLHIPAVRRLVASADDLVVVSRRVLGSGPPTIDTQSNVRIHVDRQWQRGVARPVENDDIDTRLQYFTPQQINVIRRFDTELGTVRVELVA